MTRFGLKLSFIALLLLPAITNALPLGFYIGLQAGIGKTNLSSLSESNVASDVNAVVSTIPGSNITYDGLSAHINSVSVSSINLSSYKPTVDDNVYGGRIYVGYQILDQLAFELGFLHLRNQTSKYAADGYIPVNISATINPPSAPPTSGLFTQVNRDDKYSENALDLNIKAIAPINYRTNVYAKLGVAYMKVLKRTTVTLSGFSIDGATTAPSPSSFTTTSSTNSLTLYYPTLGVGFSYCLNDHMDIDASWYRIVSRTSEIGNIDFWSIGLSYSLGGVVNALS